MGTVSSFALDELIEEGRRMANMITGEELRKAVALETFIKGGDPDSVEGVKYDFHLGTRILMTGGSPINTALLSELEKSKLQIGPGEVVFALSEEQLDLPTDMYEET